MVEILLTLLNYFNNLFIDFIIFNRLFTAQLNYQHAKVKMGFNEAVNYCLGLDMRMVKIEDEQKNVSPYFHSNCFYWLSNSVGTGP